MSAPLKISPTLLASLPTMRLVADGPPLTELICPSKEPLRLAEHYRDARCQAAPGEWTLAYEAQKERWALLLKVP